MAEGRWVTMRGHPVYVEGSRAATTTTATASKTKPHTHSHHHGTVTRGHHSKDYRLHSHCHDQAHHAKAQHSRIHPFDIDSCSSPTE